jgi:ATP-dependent helicase/nuclease subunit A
MSLTDEQLRVVEAEASVAVVAGAGTGKTHTLGHRYLQHLRRGMSPLQIVAVTFTERAAAELRARVRAYVAAELPERPEALIEVEAAQISTIHALAARICRDHPEAAEVAPDFGLLEDLDGRLWLGEQLDDALATLPTTLFTRLPYRSLRTLFARLLDDPLAAEAALSRPTERWGALVATARAEALKGLIDTLPWSEAEQTVRFARGDEGDLAETARRLAERGLELLEAGEIAEGLAAIDSVDLRGGRQGAWPHGDLPLVKAALKELRARVRAALSEGLVTLELGEADDELAALLPELRAAYERLRGALAQAKRRSRVLDFSDLEVHALRALALPEVREHYADRWRALLIDEQQDNSPAQDRLLTLLGEGKIVTAVGDEKQGIYAFRGADVQLFRSARARIRDGGGVEVVLSRSFRSHAGLLARVDTAFDRVLGELHDPLAAVRERPPHPGPHVELVTIEAERGVPKAQRLVAEAHLIGRTLEGLLEARTPVHDRDSGELRPLEPRDVAVLTRTWAPLDTYGEVLPGLGVPAVHTGGGDLFATREAKDGVALIRFLADPDDDLALATLLRSPLFARSDTDLFAFAQSLPREGAPSWWRALQEGAPPPMQEAAATLATLLGQRRSLAPSLLLALADRLTGYGAVLANLPGAARREADRRGFVDLVRTLEGGLGDPFSVARQLRRYERAGVEAPRPSLEAGDAVTLMTIHRAKGLEWPLVVVADLTRRGGGRRSDVLLDRELGVALRWRDPEGGEERVPALFTLLERRAASGDDAEQRRLLYVALTRARDRLLLSATETSGGPLDLLLPGLEAAGVPSESVPFVPADALYPNPPLPELGTEGVGDLWLRSPADLGPLADSVTPSVPMALAPEADIASGRSDAAATGDRWGLVEQLLVAAYPDLLPLVAALRGASLPPPDDDGFEIELTREGVGSGLFAPLAWRRADGARVALVNAALNDIELDQHLIPADIDAPDAVVAALRSALK